MSNQLSRRDPWRWPVIFLWCLFFLLGLRPEYTYAGLRSAGYVFSQNAVINSYHFITWCLTGYVIHFVYRRSVEGGLPPLEAVGKAIQLGVVAFVAFIDMPLEQIPDMRNATDRAIVSGMVLVKLGAWLYMLLLMARYHWRQNPDILVHSLTGFMVKEAPPKTTDAVSAKDVDTKTASTTSRPASMKEQAD